MGKNNRQEQQEQLKAYRELQARKAAEERAKQNRTIGTVCGIFIGVAVIATVLTLILTDAFLPKPKSEEETEPFSEESEEPGSDVTPFEDLAFLDGVSDYYRVETPTDYVCMNISYTDKSGVAQTGNLVIGLDSNCAPITVSHFKGLVEDGYYNGRTFGRVSPGFMIQGGFDGSNEKLADTITGEFSKNGINNPISHTRGVISMARSNSYDSGSGQFFIMHKDSTYLDGNYAGFGTVVAGMDLVDKICNIELTANPGYEQADGGKDTKPVYPVVIEEAYFVLPGGEIFPEEESKGV